MQLKYKKLISDMFFFPQVLKNRQKAELHPPVHLTPVSFWVIASVFSLIRDEVCKINTNFDCWVILKLTFWNEK